jgi:hypothetical protein
MFCTGGSRVCIRRPNMSQICSMGFKSGLMAGQGTLNNRCRQVIHKWRFESEMTMLSCFLNCEGQYLKWTCFTAKLALFKHYIWTSLHLLLIGWSSSAWHMHFLNIYIVCKKALTKKMEPQSILIRQCKITTQLQETFHTHFRAWTMLIVDDPIYSYCECEMKNSNKSVVTLICNVLLHLGVFNKWNHNPSW